MVDKDIVLIGYSGHAYVAIDICISMGKKVIGYVDIEEKKQNPYQLLFWGSEKNNPSLIQKLSSIDCFISIGNNNDRQKIYTELSTQLIHPITIIHKTSFISPKATIGKGVMISPQTCINTLATIGNAVIINTGAIVEHECIIGDFSHIAPGAVICGNVNIGTSTLIGANAVVRPNIKIGNNVIIGAGAVVVKNIPDGSKVIGNSQIVYK